MSDIPDAFGTAMEGGLYARAVQRETGEGSSGKIETDESGHFVEQACLNCGAKLMGRHCHICGQQAHLHRTLSAVGHDLLHGVLHLDGKLWHTLPLLTLHPGKLTRRYIDGERADFVSPMAMFLFSVFLMFAIFQAIGLTTPTAAGRISARSARTSSRFARNWMSTARICAKSWPRQRPTAPRAPRSPPSKRISPTSTGKSQPSTGGGT